MWNELFAMFAVSVLVGALSAYPGQVHRIWLPCLIVIAILSGTVGVAIVGGIFCLYLESLSSRTRRSMYRSFAATGVLSLLMILFVRRSGIGRLLGISEAIWMAQHSHFMGI